MLAIMGWVAGCDKGYLTPPSAPSSPPSCTPSPTAIPTVTIYSCPTAVPTSGTCQVLSAMTTVGGAGVSVSYLANPGLDYWSVSGSLPIGGNTGSATPFGQYVLRTAADWTTYVTTSVSPGG